MTEASKKHRYVGTLGAVVAVELVENQVREWLLPPAVVVERPSIGGP